MEFEVNRLDMLEAAKCAARVAPLEEPMDILNGILIEASDDTGEVFVTSTNHQMSIQLKTKASIDMSGVMLVNSRLLVGILALLPGEIVNFSADSDSAIIISGGKTVYNVMCLPAKHYPKPVMPFPDDTVKITGICSLAKRTVFAVAKDMNKPALQCVNVKLRHNSMQAVACDGNRMMLVKCEAESSVVQEFLLPGKSLQTLASISNDSDVFEVGDIGGSVVFTKDNMMFTMRKLVGEYIDINTIMKNIKPTYSAIIDVLALQNSLELMNVGAGTQPVRMVMVDGGVQLLCNGDDGASKDFVVAIVTKATPIEGFYYNIDKLLRVLRLLSGKVKIDIDTKGMLMLKSRNEVYFQVPQHTKASAAKDVAQKAA